MNSQQGLALEIAGLVFAWPGEAACLDIAAFSMSAGEKLFLHGPSGSGKTTLLSIIGGVLHASAGRVKVSGVELAAPARTRATASGPMRSASCFSSST